MSSSGAGTRGTGYLASAVALAVLWVVSGLAREVPFPPVSLAAGLIRAVPGDVATFFIETLGHWAMRLLAAGTVAGAVALGGEALHRLRRRRPGSVWPAAVALGALALAAALPAPSDEVSVPLLVAAVAAAVAAFAGTVTLLDRQPGEAEPGRRRFLALGAGGAAAVALSGAVAGWLARRLAGPDRNVTLVPPARPATIPPRAPFPEIAGITPEVTSAARHYVVDINLVQPLVEADGWTLPVTGSVQRPLELTFAGMQSSFEVVEDYSVLTCISNEVGGPLVGHSAWGGVRLADVLRAAGVRPGAADVVFRAADGYSDSIPLEVALDPAVLLCVSQNGEPLTKEHGFPCRVRIPAIYGMKNVKWLTAIEVVDRDYKGYWMKRGWSDVAVVRTQSRIDVAGQDGAARAGEPTWIAGVAWAGDRGIERVEVSTDGGRTWGDAELKEPVAAVSWRLWAYRWTPPGPGTFTVSCRATDGDGRVQTERETPPHPSGATGLHSVTVEVA